MKRTLIIPDIHLRWKQADKIIKTADANDVIFLGDFFDDFNDDPQSINETIDWLETIINKPNYTFIFGNHDVQYAFPHEHLRCSGYAQWKHFIIRDRLDKKFWDHFKFYHFLDGKWLLSHGGLHKLNVPEKIANLYKDRPNFIRELDAYMTSESQKAFREGSWFLHAGYSRGGVFRVGGINWCDHNREMYPVIGLNQIYGHSPQYESASWLILDSANSQPYFKLSSYWSPSNKQIENTNAAYNLCLDVHGNTHYAIWNGKTLSISNIREI